MSRLSRANLRARDSIFASRPEQYLGDIQARCPPDLEECVMAMEDCCEEVCMEDFARIRVGILRWRVTGIRSSGPPQEWDERFA